MTASRTQARDDLMQLATDAINDVGGIQIKYAKKGDLRPPDSSTQQWAFLRVQHQSSAKVSIGSNNGKNRHRRIGILTILVWSNGSDGLAEADVTNETILEHLELNDTTPNGVELDSITANEVQASGTWSATAITARFQYDTFR